MEVNLEISNAVLNKILTYDYSNAPFDVQLSYQMIILLTINNEKITKVVTSENLTLCEKLLNVINNTNKQLEQIFKEN